MSDGDDLAMRAAREIVEVVSRSIHKHFPDDIWIPRTANDMFVSGIAAIIRRVVVEPMEKQIEAKQETPEP